MDQQKHIQTSKSNSTIFINPKFKAHINPNFLNNVKPTTTTSSSSSSTTANNIFVNPKFINKLSGSQHQLSAVAATKTIVVPQAKIIKQTSRNLIRQPIKSPPQVVVSAKPCNPLIKIGQRKLIRPSTIAQTNHDVKIAIHDNSASKLNIRSKYKIVNKKSLNVYKIDHRRMKPVKDHRSTAKRIKFFNELISPTKVVITDYKLFRIGNPSPKLSTEKKFGSKAGVYNLLNINGVLYKSSNTKLRKQSTTSVADNKQHQLSRQSSNSGSRSLYVRGEKFLLDPSGKKLERVSNNATNNSISSKNRIYLGGLTYIAKSNNTYERTNFHHTRLHLNVAKQKSINLLSKNLVKSNVSCPIFRKLGKCLGLQRGRCTKIHDRNQVAICQKFLKGTCVDEQCLLSHDTSLSKMPTCKFFLLGECAKTDCPYLHKKVNDKTEICHDFLRGYCPKADKCNLRHEFLCPNFESKDRCTITRCPYVHKVKSTKPVAKRSTSTVTNHRAITTESSPSSSVNIEAQRYFLKDSSIDPQQLSNEGNEKLVRALTKVARMKSHYNAKDLDAQVSEKTTECQELSENCEENDLFEPVYKRRQLGKLPSFIPID